jgi:hypothetical protein
MQHTALLTALLAALALPAGDGIRLSDEPALAGARRIACEVSYELSGGALEVEMDGTPIPTEYLPRIDFSMEDERRLVVVDAFDEDGWVRLYDEAAWSNGGVLELDSSGSVEAFPWTADGNTPLLGRKVRFDREAGGARAKAGATAFADDRAADAALLDGLQVDLGLGELLPERAVAVGDTWSIDGELLAGLFEPGGDLAWQLPPEAAAYLVRDVRSQAFAGALELELDAVADGVARCTVKGELVRTTIQAGDLSRVPVTDGTATETVMLTWSVEGAFDWSVAERRLVLLDLAGDLRQVTRTVRDADQPGPGYSSVMRVEGDRKLKVTCAALAVSEARLARREPPACYDARPVPDGTGRR